MMFTAADQLRVLIMTSGKRITISRPSSGASVGLTAVKGTSVTKVQGADGNYTTFRTDDWLIVAADAAAIVRPQRGDVITWKDGPRTKTYTIHHPDQNSECVVSRPGDAEELTLRLHSVAEQT